MAISMNFTMVSDLTGDMKPETAGHILKTSGLAQNWIPQFFAWFINVYHVFFYGDFSVVVVFCFSK